MLLVKTYVDKSSIEGVGLFANEFIPKGTIVWKLSTLDIKLKVRKGDLLLLAPNTIEYIFKYAFMDKQHNEFILSFDNDRFTNHSYSPNTIPLDNGDMIAARDIAIGEEITANYYDIDDYADDKLQVLINKNK